MTGLAEVPAIRAATSAFARMQIGARRRRRFYREVAGLLRAGFSRNESIEFLWLIHSREGTRNSEPMALMLADVRARVKNGLEFGKALRKWIPREDYMVIGAIEGSDRFAEHLEALSASIGKQSDLRKTLLESLSYPFVLVLLAYGLVVYFNVEIAPALERLLPREQWTGLAGNLGAAGNAATEYAAAVGAFAAAVPPLIAFALPRWRKTGRSLADKLPVFSMYRLHTGIYFLKSLAALMSVGMSPTEAIDRIRASASPYVAYRLDLVRFHLLNGSDLGAAMRMADEGWPDAELNLSLGIFSRTPNFASQLSVMADDWLESVRERTEQSAGILRLVAFLAVFGVISGVALAMNDIQSQIAAGVR